GRRPPGNGRALSRCAGRRTRRPARAPVRCPARPARNRRTRGPGPRAGAGQRRSGREGAAQARSRTPVSVGSRAGRGAAGPYTARRTYTAPNAPVAELIDLLALERLEDNLFRGQSRDIGNKYVFGGQVLGQALTAAQATMTTPRDAHSLHAYFLRAGDIEHPIVYHVDR